MTLAGYNLQDNVYIYSNNKCMCVFLISPVPIAEPLTSELIDTPVFYNLAPRPIKYRVSVPIPRGEYIKELWTHNFHLDNPTIQSWIFSIITPVFSVTWSFRNHSTMQICCSRNIRYQCWKQFVHIVSHFSHEDIWPLQVNQDLYTQCFPSARGDRNSNLWPQLLTFQVNL